MREHIQQWIKMTNNYNDDTAVYQFEGFKGFPKTPT